MNPDHNAPPLNPLPAVVWLLVLPIVAVEAVLGAGQSGLVGGPGAIGWRLAAINAFGVFDQIAEWMVATRQAPPDALLRFVAYPFIHASFTHALIGAVFLLALGKFVGEVFRAWAVAAVFFGSAIGAALIYAALLDARFPLIGAFPAVYGLIGAFTFILWARLGELREDRRRAFTLIGFLMLFQLAFGAVNLMLLGGTSFEWVADLAGFGVGFLMSFVVSPGGWAAVLRKLRQP